jgi:hypothetical protein
MLSLSKTGANRNAVFRSYSDGEEMARLTNIRDILRNRGISNGLAVGDSLHSIDLPFAKYMYGYSLLRTLLYRSTSHGLIVTSR